MSFPLRSRPRTIPTLVAAMVLLGAPALFAAAAPAHAGEPVGLDGPCSGAGCPTAYREPNNSAAAGTDSAVAVFVGGDYIVGAESAEAEGRIVIGGDLLVGDLTPHGDYPGSYDLGVVGAGSQVRPPAGEAHAVVGGAVRIDQPHSVIIDPSGYLAYGTTVTGAVSGSTRSAPTAVGAYSAIPESIRSLSACATVLSPNGAVVRNGSGQNEFVGTGAAVQVFSLTGLPEQGIPIGFSHIADDATIVVNVLGTDPVIDSADLTFDGQQDPHSVTEHGLRLIWNFPEARTVHVQGPMQFMGAVLVPGDASVTTVDVSGANGRIWVNGDFVHGGVNRDSLGNDGLGNELHNYPFLGAIPCSASHSVPPVAVVPKTEPPTITEATPPTTTTEATPPTTTTTTTEGAPPSPFVPPTAPLVPGPTPKSAPSPHPAVPAAGQLAFTGAEIAPALIVAALSIVAGAALAILARRPRRRH